MRAETKQKVKRLNESEKGCTKSHEMSRDVKWDQAPVKLMEGVVARRNIAEDRSGGRRQGVWCKGIPLHQSDIPSRVPVK